MERKTSQQVRLSTRVSQADHQRLQKICKEYGFSSIYEVLQVLLHCFLRHTTPERDAEFEDGMSVEVETMFEELSHPEAPAPTNGRRYPKRQIR